MIKDFIVVDVLESVKSITNTALERGVSLFPVTENNKVVGIITSKELMKAHPNRIAADAMVKRFLYIDANTSIWSARELLNERNINLLLVEHNHEIVGLVTKLVLEMESAKHMDLLTGLYKSDYIFYNASKLIKNEKEISIIFIDVNDFGRIDKEYGHILGDHILQEIAILLDTYKPIDCYLCRFGGDEFIVLTPYPPNQAKTIAQTLLNVIATHEFPNEINVTISAGIAHIKKYDSRTSDVHTTVLNLINTASLASTEAKKSKEALSIFEVTTDMWSIA